MIQLTHMKDPALQTRNLEKVFMWFDNKITVMLGASNDERSKLKARKQSSALHIYLDDEQSNEPSKDDTSSYLKAVKSQASLINRFGPDSTSLDMLSHPDKQIITSKSSMK